MVAPISDILAIAKDCGDHQIAFIRCERITDGVGWAIGLTHIYVNPDIRGHNVTQGPVIGKTVMPLPKPGVGCGKMGSGEPLYTEQNITNTYIAQWIIEGTLLDGPYNDIAVGNKIEDKVKNKIYSQRHSYRCL